MEVRFSFLCLHALRELAASGLAAAESPVATVTLRSCLQPEKQKLAQTLEEQGMKFELKESLGLGSRRLEKDGLLCDHSPALAARNSSETGT